VGQGYRHRDAQKLSDDKSGAANGLGKNDSISSVMAPVEAKTAMNKPARKSVDSPNSRRSIISSSSVYMLTAGAKSIKSREKTIMTA
jgi:hypothetical protein